MGEQLTIRLLGAVAIELDGKPATGLGTRKAEALLAYLVMQQRPFSREILADLLWDDRAQEQALANLRSLLSGLKRKLNPYLLISRQTVAFNHESAYWLDAVAFEEGLASGDQNVIANLQPPAFNPGEALSLYRGDFLEGFHIREARRFEEWAKAERERLRRLAISGLRQAANQAFAANQIDRAIGFGEQLVKYDPYSEAAQRQMMRLLARSGRRNAALACYTQFRQLLADDLGVAPLPETSALYERIKSANPQQYNLPSQPTPFVGRAADLAAIEKRLADPTCRLLTIVGPGGMGKTRLSALAGRRQVGRFLNGVFFVSLTAVISSSSADLIVEAIAEAIAETVGLSFQGAEPLQRELIDYLRQKELLLVLDNFEHVLAATPLLSRIQEHAPEVKLLVTSRERLRLRGEWVYELYGLSRSAPEATHSEAVQLFLQSAGRVGVDFELETAVHPAINRICHLVRGMPLALELAASWARLLSPPEIVAEIENNLAFLTSTLRDLPERHQSMQAVFDASWRLLTPVEQAAMARLSVFRGQFSRRAAQEAADVSLPLLLTLTDKSLARRVGRGTAVAFQLHALLSQYAAEKLARQSEMERATRERHGRYYVEFLQQREPFLLQHGQKRALTEISAELDNVRAAWQWLIQQKKVDLLDRALAGMYLFYWARSWLREGVAAFQNAAAIVDDETVLARMLWRQAEFAAWLGQFDEAQSLYDRSLAILRAVCTGRELAMALEANGRLHYWQGNYARARRQFEESLAIFRALDDLHGQAQALNSLANTLCEESADYAAAEDLLAESLAISQKLGDGFGIAKAIINQGATAQATGDLKRAQQLFQQSLTLYREVEYQYGISAALSYLGQATAELGDDEAATDLIEQSLAIYRESGNRRAIVGALEQLAGVVFKNGAFAAAKQYYAEALHLAQTLQSPRFIQELLTAVAELALAEGKNGQALKLVAFVLSQPDIGQMLQEKANRLLTQLTAAMSPTEADAYREQGCRLTAVTLIGEVISEILTLTS